MRPHYISLDKLEEGNPINKSRDAFNKQNEAILYHKDPIGVVFIGDSITDYWDLESYFELDNHKRIINRGISNDRSMYVNYRFQADALQLNPDLIILSIGVNNTKQLDHTPDEQTKHAVVQEVTQDIETMIIKAHEHNIAIAITSVTSTNRPQLKSFPLRIETIKEINRILEQLALKYHIPYIDYYSKMTVIENNMEVLNPGLTDDGLHPHVLGYDIMADVLVDTITDYPIKLKNR